MKNIMNKISCVICLRIMEIVKKGHTNTGWAGKGEGYKGPSHEER